MAAYVQLDPGVAPTATSLAACEAQAKTGERACTVCGNPVHTGSRRAVLTAGGEGWQHLNDQ